MDSKKRNFIGKLREKWIEVLIATLVTVSFTALSSYSKSIIGEVEKLISNYNNISKEDALKLSRDKFGARAVDAIPFRNKGGDAQFIAVALDDCGYTYNDYSFYLMSGHKEIYDSKELPLSSITSPGINSNPGINCKPGNISEKLYMPSAVFGVIDIDKDGFKEIYSISRTYTTAGSVVYTVTVDVFNTKDKNYYSARASTIPGSITFGNILYDPEPAKDPQVDSWIRDKIKNTSNLLWFDEFSKDDEPDASDTGVDVYEDVIDQYIKTNGKGISLNQKPTIMMISGEIPESGGSIFCELEDENYRWVSYFKGPIFGYDKQENKSFVVYVPENNYLYSRSMVSGKSYLWLGLISELGIFAFNKDDRYFKLIPFSERLKEEDSGFYKEFGGTIGYLNGNLRVKDSKLFLQTNNEILEEIKLEYRYPSFIDPLSEFQSPIECK